MPSNRNMRIGDRIFASCNLVEIQGTIICGWSPRTHEFTSRLGICIDPSEMIAIKIDPGNDADRVKINGAKWYCEPLDDCLREGSFYNDKRPAISETSVA